jgi:arylsulfatase A
LARLLLTFGMEKEMKKHSAILPALVALLWALSVTHSGAAAAENPNILYILTDDLGYGDVHCLNPDRCKIPTPNIDRFASQGMTFTDAHSATSICTPTRYGVMTGRYSWRTKLQSGVVVFGGPTINAERKTVPSFLRDQGYHTAGFGKWHLGLSYQLPGADKVDTRHVGNMPIGARIVDGPVERGFHQFYHLLLFGNKWTMTEDTEVVHDLKLDELLPRILKRGKEYIAKRANSEQPFFMYWAPPVPHIPLAPTPEWRGKSEIGIYGDYVMQLDAAIGELLAALDDHGLADSTLVIITSDNGTAPYPPIKAETLEKKGHYASGQYRGYKSDIFEGGHRIPFFARWPGNIEAGSVTDQLTCLNDLFATVADLTGAELEKDWAEDSVSILPMLLKQEAVDRGPVVHHSLRGRFAVRNGKWKLIFGPGSGGWSQPKDKEALEDKTLPLMQLYDLEADPAEQKNLQAKYPEVVEQMTKLMESLISRGRSTPGPDLENDKWSRIVLMKDKREP